MAFFNKGSGFNFMPELDGLYAGLNLPDTSGIQAAVSQPGYGQPQTPKKKGFFSRGSGFWDALGVFGDALSGQQVVAPMIQQRRKGVMDREDEERKRTEGIADYRTKREIDASFAQPAEKPSLFREYELFKGLSPEDQQKVAQFMRMRNPVQPVVMGQYDTMEGGGPSMGGMGGSGGEVTATNPQTGQKVRLNPQTGQWEPMGGASQSSGSGGFPGPY